MQPTTISIITSVVALLVSIVSLTLSIAQFYYKVKEDERKQRADLLSEMSDLLSHTIVYPYLEHPSITKTWNEHRGSDDEKYMRYDQFCNLLFNFLSRLYDYCGKNKEKVEGFVDVKTWVRLHRQNWENPTDENENVDGYSEEFRNFINSYLR